MVRFDAGWGSPLQIVAGTCLIGGPGGGVWGCTHGVTVQGGGMRLGIGPVSWPSAADPRTLARGDVLFLPAHAPVTVEPGRRASISVGTGADALRVHIGRARVRPRGSEAGL